MSKLHRVRSVPEIFLSAAGTGNFTFSINITMGGINIDHSHDVFPVIVKLEKLADFLIMGIKKSFKSLTVWLFRGYPA
jgi:hypothetical protein